MDDDVVAVVGDEDEGPQLSDARHCACSRRGKAEAITMSFPLVVKSNRVKVF